MSSQRYRLEERIATGGMGEVWRATDTVLGRQVAVKLLKAEYADDAGFRSRFTAEAKHAAALHHPNVASVFDFGEMSPADADTGTGTGTGTRPFLVMELIPGRPLSELLRDGVPMTADAAAGLMAQAADAIAAAHALGIVHRDVKPGNLLVTPQGQVKITDFGIARAADSMALTLTGQIVGTPSYLSPEQVDGRTATPASDIYALGVVLYECLAGRRPFVGDTPITTALAHLRAPAPTLPEAVPAHLRAVVERALAKDPAARFDSAADFAAALRARSGDAAATMLLGAPTEVGPTTRSAIGSATGAARGDDEQPRGAPWLKWAGAAVAVLLIAALFTALNSVGENSGSEAESLAPAGPAADAQVRVRPDDYLGSTVAIARTRLKKLGLDVSVAAPRTNPGEEREGTVAAVSPTGMVDADTTVVLEAWGAPVAVVPPTSTASSTPAPAKPQAEPNPKIKPSKTTKAGKTAKPGKPTKTGKGAGVKPKKQQKSPGTRAKHGRHGKAKGKK